MRLRIQAPNGAMSEMTSHRQDTYLGRLESRCMTIVPETRFARNGDVHIAYQTVGTGSLDLLVIDKWVYHVEAVWDYPDLARFLRRLSSFSRVIHFDRRGTGLSDRSPSTGFRT